MYTKSPQYFAILKGILKSNENELVGTVLLCYPRQMGKHLMKLKSNPYLE